MGGELTKSQWYEEIFASLEINGFPKTSMAFSTKNRVHENSATIYTHSYLEVPCLSLIDQLFFVTKNLCPGSQRP